MQDERVEKKTKEGEGQTEEGEKGLRRLTGEGKSHLLRARGQREID